MVNYGWQTGIMGRTTIVRYGNSRRHRREQFLTCWVVETHLKEKKSLIPAADVVEIFRRTTLQDPEQRFFGCRLGAVEDLMHTLENWRMDTVQKIRTNAVPSSSNASFIEASCGLCSQFARALLPETVASILDFH